MDRRFIAVLVAVPLFVTVILVRAQQSDPAAVLLAAAQQKASLEGNLPVAIQQYQSIVDAYARSDRPVTAQALLHMADLYRKLGDPKADALYAKVVRSYADQKAPATAAAARLATRRTPRLVCDACGDEDGSVSADGRLMATTSGMGDTGDIGILDLSTGALKPLHVEGSGADAAGTPEDVLISPDARQIAYVWLDKDDAELRVVSSANGSAKGKIPVKSPQHSTVDEPLAWTADGSLLVGTQRPDSTVELGMVSPTGARTAIKSLNWQLPGSPFHQVSLSPDGRYIAYAALSTNPPAPVNPEAAKSLAWQIHALAIDGSSDVPVTSGAGAKQNPVWAPDGRHILYMSNVSGAWGLFAASIQGGRPGETISVRNNIGDDTLGMGVTRAGTYYFYAGQPGVYWTSVADAVPGGQHSATIIDRFVGERPTFSPDGKFLAVHRSRSSATEADSVDVIVRTVDGGDERVFRRPGMQVTTFPDLWFASGAALLTLASESHQPASWYRIDVASAEFQRLMGAQSNTPFYPHQNIKALSPDGKTVYFGSWKNKSSSSLDRVVALDLTTGAFRDVFRLPVAEDALPQHAQDFAIAMSPDGRSLALFYADQQLKAAHVAVVNVDGAGYRELCPPVQAHSLRNKIVWTRNGRWVYFATTGGKEDDDTHRIMRVPASGGTPEYVGIEVKHLEEFDVNADGTRVAYSPLFSEGGAQAVWALDVSDILKGPR